jgi:hypothetical protein
MKRNHIMLIVSGITASVLYYGSTEFSRYIIPPAWLGSVWNALKHWGVPISFLTGYIAFVWQYIHSWIVLAVLSFGIGISGVSWGKRFAMMLAVWLPVVDFIFALFYCLQGGYGIDSYQDALRLLFSWRIRLISLLAVPIGIGAWYLGSLGSRLSMRSSEPPPAVAAGGRSP